MHSTRTRLATLQVDATGLRNETLDGREYLVANCVPLREGVHNSEFISFEEIAVFDQAWAGVPLPIDHPTDSSGSPLTANSPKIMQSSVIGMLFNVVAREDLRGISGEIWVDIEKAPTVIGGAEVLNKLNNNEPLEVSTAYFCFIDNIPGEWKNPNGTVEKFRGTQTGVRPDHLALLPFDTGACSWEDGCGAPRANSDITPADHNINSHNMPDKTLQINGKQLGRALKGALAAHADGDGTSNNMVDRLAIAAGISAAKVQALVDGTLDFAPRKWLEIFSVVLDVDGWDIFMAASNDNSDARHAENTIATKLDASSTENVKQKIEEPLSIVDNKPNTETEKTNHETCEPCQKSLKVRVTDVVQEVVTNMIRSAGIRWNEKEVETPLMDKKVRVDALIASDKTQFSENHRDWLMGLNEDQLTVIEPKVEETEKIEEPEVKVEAAANTAVTETKSEPAKTEPMTKEQILAAIGISESDIQIIKANADAKNAARNTKITEITAVKDCPYSKAELEAFSDTVLDKTLNMLQPDAAPFRVAPGRQNSDDSNTVPAPPAILLAVAAKKEAK